MLIVKGQSIIFIDLSHNRIKNNTGKFGELGNIYTSYKL